MPGCCLAVLSPPAFEPGAERAWVTHGPAFGKTSPNHNGGGWSSWQTAWLMGQLATVDRDRLLARGRFLEGVTLGWNVVGIIVLAVAAIAARSVALAGFGLDSLIEIGASSVVLWELADVAADRQRRAMRLIGAAFVALAVYLVVQSTLVLVAGYHARPSSLGIAWTAVTAAVMFALAAGKAKTGTALDNPVLRTEGRVTMIDGLLGAAVLIGLVLNAAFGWWWADPAAGYVLVYYGIREAHEALTY